MPRINPITGEREVVQPTKGNGENTTTTEETTNENENENENTNTNPYMQTKPPGMPESDWEKYQAGKSAASSVGKISDVRSKPISGDKLSRPSKQTSKYDISNNQAFYDVNASEGLPSQTTTQSGKTSGMGAEAAVGTTYSWDDKAKELAENTYQQKVLEEKQNMLTQRQEMEKNAQQYQTQADMQKYSDNQTADKVGWTGGYVLDQERQREYMKQSIQAQLYGAMELQKYGYDTAMAAARLSYDANLLTYAEEYYNQAVQNAIAEGNLLGTYFSAEVKEMLQQYTIAGEKLLDSSLSEEEKTRAQKIVDTINGWFGENNISPAGIKTAAQLSAELAAENQRNELLWTKYNAAMQTAEATKKENSSAFIMLDDKGNPIYDGYSIKMGDWNTIDGKEIVENYLNNDPSGQRRQEFFGYLDVQLAGQSGTDFKNWLKANGYMGEDGTILGDTVNLYGEFLGESDVFTSFIEKKFGNLSEEDKKTLANTLNGYDLTVNLPDGKIATYTLNITNEKNNSAKTKEGKDSNEVLKEDLALTTTYTKNNQNAMLNKLFKTNKDGELLNKNFDTLLQVIDGCTAANPDTWNEDNGWWNGLVKFSNYYRIANAIQSRVNRSDNRQNAKIVDEILKSATTTLGEENIMLLGDIADKWSNMSEREKMSLPEEEKKYYEQATNFMVKIGKLKEARDFYYRNDSTPFTWDYVGDTWAQVGHNWSNINSFGDFLGSLGGTWNALGTSVYSGVLGVFNWAFEQWGWK